MAKVVLQSAALDVDAAEQRRCRALIAPEEQARADQFCFARDRRRFIVRRARLRQWLGAALDRDPAALQFTSNAWGKPTVAGAAIHFSLSHSGDQAICAISEVEVGCDIEAITDNFEWPEVAQGLFAPAECAALLALPKAEGRAAFFACWARKEAFVKALGEGLSYPLDAFEVTVSGEAQLRRGGTGWAISAFAFRGYAGAVVARGARVELEWSVKARRAA